MNLKLTPWLRAWYAFLVALGMLCVGAAVPPSQVHLALTPVPDITIVLRLKSTRALDELVGVLLEYRKIVWP